MAGGTYAGGYSNVEWGGHSFTVYDPALTTWKKVPGLYVFAGLAKDRQEILRWHAYYIGETQDFSDRFPNHEKWQAARRLGATHIHALIELQAGVREKEEKRLIRVYQPPLNVQHKR